MKTYKEMVNEQVKEVKAMLQEKGISEDVFLNKGFTLEDVAEAMDQSGATIEELLENIL